MTVRVERVDSWRGTAYRLTTEILLDAPRDQIFDFFADAFELETITPGWLRFSVQTAAPIKIRPGVTIDYRLRLRGIPIRWRSRISEWDPPLQFVDEQIRGPYRFWHHRHTFEAIGETTLVRDAVHYAVPLGPITHRLVRRELVRIFEFRHQRLRDIFGLAGAAPHVEADVVSVH